MFFTIKTIYVIFVISMQRLFAESLVPQNQDDLSLKCKDHTCIIDMNSVIKVRAGTTLFLLISQPKDGFSQLFFDSKVVLNVMFEKAGLDKNADKRFSISSQTTSGRSISFVLIFKNINLTRDNDKIFKYNLNYNGKRKTGDYPLYILEKCYLPIDLVFALDASGSVDVSGFKKIKAFTKRLVDGFQFGVRDTHVGVVTFSEIGKIWIGLTRTFDKTELFDKIDNIIYDGYRTNTSDAFEAAGKVFKFSMAGGTRQGGSKVLILLTDGPCTLCGNNSVETSAKKLKDMGVTIFTVGVTDRISREELRQISSNPSDKHMFFAKTFSDLPASILGLQEGSCTASYSTGYRGCSFKKRDGKVRSKFRIGNQTGNACIDACLKKKQTGQSINGITIKADGTGGCWCEQGMTHTKAKYLSCLIWHDSIVLEGTGYRGCSFLKVDGKGRSEFRIGNQTGKACIDECLNRRFAGQWIDVITIKADGTGGCWCEQEITHIKTKYWSCLLADPILKELKELSTNTTSLEISEINDKISNVVRNFNGEETHNVTQIAKSFIKVISNVLESNKTLIENAEKMNGSATSLLKNIDSFFRKVGRAITNAGDNVTINTKNIGAQVVKIAKEKKIKIYAQYDQTRHLTSVGIHNSNEPSHFLASIEIPKSTFTSSDGRVYSAAYLQNTLFVGQPYWGREVKSKVQSIVFSVSLNISVKSLINPVVLQFRKNDFKNKDSKCVFWKYKGENVTLGGDWDTEGCKFVSESSNGIVTCECNHLTNFALIFDVYQKGNNQEELRIVTKIGCSLSIFGLLSTIIIFSLFPQLRKKLPVRIKLSLCVSLLILLIIFLAGAERTNDRLPCHIFAGVLHYFTMTTFAWMCVVAVQLYLMLVKVYRVESQVFDLFFTKASIFAWGFPLLIVLATIVVNPNKLSNDKICFPQGVSAYFGVILPITLTLFVNIILFTTIMVKLVTRKTPGETMVNRDGRNIRDQMKNGLIISVLLGLTWVFPIFAVEEVQFVFQLLFCVFSSLQGFFIFLFYVLMNKEVKMMLKDKFCKRWRPKNQNATEEFLLS